MMLDASDSVGRRWEFMFTRQRGGRLQGESFGNGYSNLGLAPPTAAFPPVRGISSSATSLHMPTREYL
jgi:hypothetical protein